VCFEGAVEFDVLDVARLSAGLLVRICENSISVCNRVVICQSSRNTSMADHMEIDGVAAAAEVTPLQHDATEATPEAGHSHSHSHTHTHDQPHIQDDPLAKQRFEVKKWTAVAFWSWGMYNRCPLYVSLLTHRHCC
jgi:ABC-type nickel/cobalt efflux system permease component RcnA